METPNMRMIRSPAAHFSCSLVAKTTFSPEEYKKEEEIHAAAKEHPLQKVDWLDWYEVGGEGRKEGEGVLGQAVIRGAVRAIENQFGPAV